MNRRTERTVRGMQILLDDMHWQDWAEDCGADPEAIDYPDGFPCAARMDWPYLETPMAAYLYPEDVEELLAKLSEGIEP